MLFPCLRIDLSEGRPEAQSAIPDGDFGGGFQAPLLEVQQQFPPGISRLPVAIRDRDQFLAGIAYLDDDLKRLFGGLRRRDLLARTLAILVSDHGEEFGEHGTFGHGRDLHMQSIRVPLLLRLPGIVPGEVTVPEPVTLRDIPATVVGLLGLPDDGQFPGQSLVRYWLEPGRREPESLDPVLSELSRDTSCVGAPVAKGDMRSLVIRDIHYIRNGDGTEEVYDLRQDPAEHDDLMQTPRGAEAAAQAGHILKRMTR